LVMFQSPGLKLSLSEVFPGQLLFSTQNGGKVNYIMMSQK